MHSPCARLHVGALLRPFLYYQGKAACEEGGRVERAERDVNGAYLGHGADTGGGRQRVLSNAFSKGMQPKSMKGTTIRPFVKNAAKTTRMAKTHAHTSAW